MIPLHFTYEFNEDGNDTRQDNMTAGIDYRSADNLRLQLDYMHKQTVNEFEADLEDDILYMNIQFTFDALLLE